MRLVGGFFCPQEHASVEVKNSNLHISEAFHVGRGFLKVLTQETGHGRRAKFRDANPGSVACGSWRCSDFDL